MVSGETLRSYRTKFAEETTAELQPEFMEIIAGHSCGSTDEPPKKRRQNPKCMHLGEH